MSVQTTDAAARIQPGQMRATYAIWLKAPGASLHDVVELLERSERPTMTTYRGVPAILLFVERKERFGEIIKACANHASASIRRIEVCLDTEDVGAMTAESAM